MSKKAKVPFNPVIAPKSTPKPPATPAGLWVKLLKK